jgi:murein DD-endopeptidase MepM/ murein hydrolase activator NlpD
LPQHRSTPPPPGVSQGARDRWLDPERNDVTDIIPFNEFGSLDDLDFRDNSAFDTEVQVLHAPELDDLHDVDDLEPLRLAVPAKFRADPSERYADPYAYHSHGADVSDAPEQRGQHRKPAAGALKGRVMIAAMAAGAAAAAAHSAITPKDTASAETVLAADQTALEGGAITTSSSGIQLVSVKPAADSSVHSEELANGVAYAQERAEREARLARPLFVMPTKGIFTSGFGYRWGALHGGVDLANSIGTPIYAVSDGVVIDAGPTAGFGAWVKLRHSDGTVTLYGHVNTWVVNIGERVMAGDQIATIGNRGNSTGPHLHFEVLLNGTNRIDPLPWLAQRGLNVGPYAG